MVVPAVPNNPQDSQRSEYAWWTQRLTLTTDLHMKKICMKIVLKNLKSQHNLQERQLGNWRNNNTSSTDLWSEIYMYSCPSILYFCSQALFIEPGTPYNPPVCQPLSSTTVITYS